MVTPSFDNGSVDPRAIYDEIAKAQAAGATAQQQTMFDPFGRSYAMAAAPGVGTQTVNPEAPNMPPAGDPFGLWQRFLELSGGGKYEGGQGGWTQIGDQWYRRGGPGKGKTLGKDVDAYGLITQGVGGRGFDLFGLAPQTMYWENLEGSGVDKLEANRRTPGYIWGAYGNESAGLPSWLAADLGNLQKVWGQFSDSEQKVFLDRMLRGAGLPAYLQKFLAARPQWITDYITNTFKM